MKIIVSAVADPGGFQGFLGTLLSEADHVRPCKIFPQSAGNGISETLDFKIFWGSMPHYPPRGLAHFALANHAFGTQLSLLIKTIFL